jgi:hypothetical protein
VVNQQRLNTLDLWSDILLAHEFEGSASTEYCSDSAGSYPIDPAISLGAAPDAPANIGGGRGSVSRWQARTDAIAPLSEYSGDFTWLCWFRTVTIGSSEWPAITRLQGSTSLSDPYALSAIVIPTDAGDISRCPSISVATGGLTLHMTPQLSDNTWYLIGATYDSATNTVQTYLNGASDVSGTQAITFPSTCYLAYGSTWSSSVDFKGYQGANRIWLRKLTDEEVAGHYNGGDGVAYSEL